MFKAIARILSTRETPKSGFVPPDNRYIGSVPEFRAHLLEIGLTESEASHVLVKRTVAGMWYLASLGYSRKQIMFDMPASRWLEIPTREHDYYNYSRISRENFEQVRLQRTCGLG